MMLAEPTCIKMPQGFIEYTGTFDNGGRTFDRYSAGFETGPDPEAEEFDTYSLMIGPTGNAPNGVCMSSEYPADDGDGAPVVWADLPEPVQRAIIGEMDLVASLMAGHASMIANPYSS